MSTSHVASQKKGGSVNIAKDNKGELRQKEFEEAVMVLGGKAFVYLDIPDGRFSENANIIRSKFSELFADHRPQIVFIPSPVDLHPDHRETALACIDVSRGFPHIKLGFYEIYNPTRFNVLIDIGAVIETKKNALLRYHYSMLKKEETFIASNLALNRSRSLFTLQDSYYEAFWIPLQAPPTLTDTLKWFSSDLYVPSPENRLLDNLRFADALLREIRELEEELGEKRKSLEQLILDLKQKDETIASLRDHIRLLETGIFQRFANTYHRIRDAFFPEGTSRKRIYEKGVRAFKKLFR